MDKEPIEQTVHPLANVEIVGSARRRTLYSCSGDVVDIDIDARVSRPLVMTNALKNHLWRITGHRTVETHIPHLLLDPLVQYHPPPVSWPIAPFHPRSSRTLIHFWCFG